MIFKTINSSVDETRKTLALFNKDWNTYKRNWQNANGVFCKIGSVFTPANAITKSDIEAIKAYNSQIDSCVTSQTAFNRTMLNASPAAQNLVASYNGGKVSAQGMATAQNAAKASTIGLTIAQTALNAAIGMGIELLISLVVKGIDKLIHANEEAIEKAEELRRKYDEFKSTNENNVSTLKGLEEEFKKLSKGVSQYGDNVSLTTEQYERYKEIIQQIVGMSPSLAEGYSTENGYIVDKNGLLERAIELQEQEYRNELRKITNLDNLKTSMSGYIAEYKEAFDGGLATEDMSAIATKKATEFSNALYKAFNVAERKDYNNENFARDILNSLGIDDIEKEMQQFFNDKGYYQSNWFFDEYADEIAKNINVITDALSYEGVELSEDEFENRILTVKDCAQAYLDMKDSISMANESIQRDLQYIAEYSDGYSNLTTEQQKFVNEFLKGFNIDDIVSRDWFGNLTYDEDKMKSVKRQITDFVEAFSQDETTKTALADLYAIPTDKQSISEFVDQFRSALEIIKAYCDKNGIEIPIAITDSEQVINDLEAQYQRAVDFAKDKFDGYDPAEFFEKHSINTQEEIDIWQKIAQRVRDAAEAEKEYLSQEQEQDFSPTPSISDTVDQLNTRLKPAMNSLQSAYQNVFTDNKFTPENVGVDMLYSIKEDIDTLNSMEGVNISIDASVFENFARVLNNTSSTADQVKTQFNELANTIVRASGSVAVNTDTFDILASSLEDMGFVNARSVLEEVITAQQAFQEVSEQLGLSLEEVTNATYEETVQMLLAAQASELDTQALWKLAVAQGTITDGTIATETNVDALLAEAKAAGLAAATLTALENVRNGNIKDTNAAQAIMEQAKQSIIASMSDFKLDYDFNPAIKSAGKAGSDTGKSYKEGLKEELSDLNSVISGITKSIDGQIDVIDEQKDTALDAIEAQIEALEEERDARLAVIDAQKAQLEEEIESIDKKIKSKQDEIDAINDAAEARKREIDLQKAQYNLERMQNQRTILQYSQEKGMHYVADEQGIRDAREDVDDARRQIEIADIEKEIDLLESQKDLLNEQIDLLDQQADKINEFYDTQIKTLEKQKEETEKYFESLTKALEDSKSKYTELTEIADKAELSAKLAQLGIDEAALLNGSEEEFQKLKSAYMDTVFQLNEGNTQVLSKLQELSGYSGTAPALLSDSNSALDTMNGKLDLSNQSVGTVNSSLGAAAAIAGEIASNVGTLETNLGIVNTFLTDEQTAFSNLKATIDEVITALNLKIQAIQAAQSAAGIATTTEIAYFLLLRDKIDEIKQSIAGINDAIIIIDSQPIDHLADSFQHLYEQILLVSTTLGSGMEGQGAGLAGNIISAMQALNKISFEEGIIAQLTNLKTAIDAVTNAISGGGDTSGGETQGGSGATTGGNPGGKDSGGAGSGKSLTGAITDIGTTTSEVIGEPDAEGDGTVIGAFGALETAVDDVTTAIGSGDSEDNEAKGADGEDDNSLIDSITGLGDTTEDILGEPGGDGVIGRFEQFKEPIAAADEHVRSIYKGLTDIDGTEAECTIKVHIETDGNPNFTGADQVLGSMNLKSADYAATLNQNTTYDPNQDHSVFGKLYKAWNSHYGSNNQGVETIVKTLSRHLVMEHSQQMTKEITRISNSNHAANNGRDNRPPVTVQIGDIHLTGVQDVNGLAQAIKTRLPGQMMQEYFKN